MEKDQEFIKQLEYDIIPRVKSMIDEEEEHLQKLNSYKGVVDVSEMIIHSQAALAHMKHRYQEYQDYIKEKNYEQSNIG